MTKLTKLKTLPKDAEPVEGLTLAHGEATGHHHSFRLGSKVRLFRTKERSHEASAGLLVVVDERAVLEHQEHAPQVVEPGVYEVGIEREYTPQEIRRAAD